MTTTKTQFGVPPVERAFQLLHYIGDGNSCSNISKAAKESGINRTTLLRLLETLSKQRMIEADEKGGYILGTGLIHLASKASQSRDVVTVSQPELRKLAGTLGLSAHLGIVTGVDILYLLRESPDLHLVSNVRVGSRLPIHATTIGRIILAHTNKVECEQLLKDVDLYPVTKKTPTTLKQLKAQLTLDRQQGFAWSEGFYEPAIGSAAVAIFDSTQSVVAAINVTGPVQEFRDEANRHDEILRELRRAGQNISVQLGYFPGNFKPEALNE